MHRKNITAISLFGSSALFFFLGVYTLINYQKTFTMIIKVTILILGISSILQFVNAILTKIGIVKNTVNWITPILNAGLAIFLKFAPTWFYGIIPEFFGIWAIINAILNGIMMYKSYSDHIDDWIWRLISTVLYLIVGISFIIRPLHHFVTVSVITGIYFILYGITFLGDFMTALYPPKDVHLKRRFRMVLPPFITAFIPQKLLTIINNIIAGDKKRNETLLEPASILENGVELELFIHLSEDASSAFGHCDVCFENTVISYGCYDSKSNRLFGMLSDGVMVFTEREAYIHHCLEYEKKVLVGFVINTTRKQIEAVKRQINSLREKMIPWHSDYELEQLGKLHVDTDYNDPSSQLYKATKAKFYKFTKGEFKTYFVLGTNCVMVADHIVGASGINTIGRGIITPGTYYAFLNNAYNRGEKIIARKNVYYSK